MGARGLLGLLMLLPLLFVCSLALTLLWAVLILVTWVAVTCGEKGGLWRLLGVFTSFVFAGICIGLGYWFGFEAPKWIFPFVFPILGGIYIIGGGLIIIIGIRASLFAKKKE